MATELLANPRSASLATYSPLAWAGLTLVSFLLLGITFIIGAAASGLDVGEKCAEAGQFFDRAYRKQHQEESRRVFPMHSACNADFDLVPAWVNPGLVISAVLTSAFLVAYTLSLAARSSRTQAEK